MKKYAFLLVVALMFSFKSHSQLIINELSQGPSGAKEYIEFLVTGTPVCGSNNTVDLRGWIIDDNNSWHATGAGTGIAGGHARFDSIAQWANVKLGSLILIYNDADVSSAVAALSVDTNDADNDLVYIIPVSSSVIQKNITLPASNGSMTTYAVPGTVYSAIGTYVGLGMANGDDAFHTVSPANYAAAYHAIGWGNNNTAVNVYYNGSQSGMVIYMANTVNNDPFNQANYIDSSATTQETPGAPNSPANAVWITSLSNNGQPFLPPTITFNSPAPITCNNSSSIITASTNAIGASFVWSNNTIGSNDTVYTAGSYTVTVTDVAGVCSASASINVTSTSGITISTSSTSTTCGASDGSATVTVTGGSAVSYSWSNGGADSTIINVPAGSYSVTVDGGGGCSATATVVVGSSNGTNVTINAGDTVFCSGDSTQICAPNSLQSYLWSTGETTDCIYAKQGGNYYVTVTDTNGCTALSNPIAVSIFPQPPVSISVNGNSLTAYSAESYQWYLNNAQIQGATDSTYVATVTGSYTVLVTDTNGCSALSNAVPVNVTAIEGLETPSVIKIFPNPFTQAGFAVEVGSDYLNAKVELLNAKGQVVFVSVLESRVLVIAQPLASGVYWLKLQNRETTATKKLIKF